MNTYGASASTSSGPTKSRPCTTARAWSAGNISTSERVDAPCSTRRSARNARARSTSDSRTMGAMATPVRSARRAATTSERETPASAAALPSPGAGYALSTSISAARAMCVIAILKRKRSSCGVGSGYVPATSSGFCVAMTKNSSSSACVRSSIVTCFSAIPSSSAACTFGEVRLISSVSSTCAKIGPRRSSKALRATSKTLVPVMSLGSRSGVN